MRQALALAAGLAAAVSAQSLSDIPTCAQSCITTAVADSTSCGADDYPCICNSETELESSATTCVISACGESVAIASVLPAVSSFCSEVSAETGSATAAASTSTVVIAVTTSDVSTVTAASSSPTATETATAVILSSGSVTATAILSASSSSSLLVTNGTALTTDTSVSTATVASGTSGSSGASETGTGTASSSSSTATGGAAQVVGSIGALGAVMLGMLAAL